LPKARGVGLERLGAPGDPSFNRRQPCHEGGRTGLSSPRSSGAPTCHGRRCRVCLLRGRGTQVPGRLVAGPPSQGAGQITPAYVASHAAVVTPRILITSYRKEVMSASRHKKSGTHRGAARVRVWDQPERG